jgi:hypothetical protein
VSDDRKCRNCGGLDEFLYEINWQPVYYCATCDVESNGSLSERVGPDERFEEETGEQRVVPCLF